MNNTNYKFRVECSGDVERIAVKLIQLMAAEPNFNISKLAISPRTLPFSDDREVVIGTNIPPQTLAALMNSIEDCHVAAESLKEASVYDGSRDGMYL